MRRTSTMSWLALLAGHNWPRKLALMVFNYTHLTDVSSITSYTQHIAQLVSGVDLLASFLSSKSNQRTDSYSCEEPENALRLVHRIVKSIRSSCQPGFVIGIKLNSADYVSGGHDAEGRALSHLRLLASWCMIDFVEISGGDYEDPGKHVLISLPNRSLIDV
jgi:hypothetical protein